MPNTNKHQNSGFYSGCLSARYKRAIGEETFNGVSWSYKAEGGQQKILSYLRIFFGLTSIMVF